MLVQLAHNEESQCIFIEQRAFLEVLAEKTTQHFFMLPQFSMNLSTYFRTSRCVMPLGTWLTIASADFRSIVVRPQHYVCESEIVFFSGALLEFDVFSLAQTLI
jgi:hypothetical protein